MTTNETEKKQIIETVQSRINEKLEMFENKYKVEFQRESFRIKPNTKRKFISSTVTELLTQIERVKICGAVYSRREGLNLFGYIYVEDLKK